MKDTACISRLLASSLHDMRNVLAIIRESAGLAQDVSSLGEQGGAASDSNRQTLLSSLESVQNAVGHGAAVIEAMDYMAQLENQKNISSPSCDLQRVCQGFCLMAARWAKGVRISLTAGEAREAVWAALPVAAVYCALLDILDLCASVGGQVDLLLTAARYNGQEGIWVELAGGDNLPLVLSAMTGNPTLESSAPDWETVLTPCTDGASSAGETAGQRFFLALRAGNTTGK